MNKGIWLILGLFCALIATKDLSAQENETNNPPRQAATIIGVNFGGHLPGGDLKDRFGMNGATGFHLWYKTTGNFIFGFEGSLFFGNTIVEESLISNLVTFDKSIVGIDGLPSGLQFSERGFIGNGMIGKIFNFNPKQPHTGLLFTLSGGVLQHKIRIDDKFDSVPQLQGEYKKGYDRLSNGMAIKEFIGWINLPQNRRANFYFGLEFIQAFTQNKRNFNFDEELRDDKKRLDLFFGLRLGWMMPLYGKEEGGRYYVD